MIYKTAGEIINVAAAEFGLTAVADPYSSVDAVFIQLRTLLNTAVQELLGMHEWQRMIKTHSFTTVVPPDTGDYPLPIDFLSMIDQTGWTPSVGAQPLWGPLSPQEWTFLVATNGMSSSIYVQFRIQENKLRLLPQPPANGVQISFEYLSMYCIAASGTPTVLTKAEPTVSGDIIHFMPIVIIKFLKLKFTEAKGFDSAAAEAEFARAYFTATGKDIPAPVLTMSGSYRFPYLGWRNIPDTNYGI